MKHIKVHDFLQTFIDSEEPLPLTPPDKGGYDETSSVGIDIRSDPHMSLLDFIEISGQMPNGADTPTSIKDNLEVKSESPVSDSDGTAETVESN